MFVKLTGKELPNDDATSLVISEQEDRLVDCVSNPLFVKWQKKHSAFIACDEAEGEGVVSEDGTKIYHLAGVHSHGRFPYGDVAYEEISEEEYATLKAELEKNNETFTVAEFIAEVNAE